MNPTDPYQQQPASMAGQALPGGSGQPPQSNPYQTYAAQPGMPLPPRTADPYQQVNRGQTVPVAGQPPALGMQQSPASMGPQAKINPNSTQNVLQIAEIRDGIVIMNDGSFRSVVMVKSINFDLMSPQEKEAVEFTFQGFLNSLYFPIQIFIRSEKVDLRPYIEKLDKIRTEHDNMLLALMMEDYITYIDNLSVQTNIMDKRFYIVIPFFPVADLQRALASSKTLFSGLAGIFKQEEKRVVINEGDLEKAKTELRNRVQAVLSGMLQCGIQGLPLDTQELIELYYDTYNPDTATRQQLKNFDDLTAPVVTKGEGAAPQPNLDKELN